MRERDLVKLALRTLSVIFTHPDPVRLVGDFARRLETALQERGDKGRVASIYPSEEGWEVVFQGEDKSEHPTLPEALMHSFFKKSVGVVLHLPHGAEDTFKSPEGVGVLKKVVYEGRQTGLVFVIVSTTKDVIPKDFQRYFAVEAYPLPAEEEILHFLENFLKANVGEEYEEAFENLPPLEEEVAGLLTGLTVPEIENALSLAIERNGSGKLTFSKKALLSVKEQLIKRNPVLEVFHPQEDLPELIGFERVKLFVHKALGKGKARGVLLLGVPGIGKSLLAKRVALESDLPAVFFNLSRVFSKWVGESERQIRDALRTIEDLGRCVVFMDEIDKQLTGMGDSSGTSQRVLGEFLTWLQENRSGAFVIATANRIEHLPPELLRAGRWNGIFFADWYPKTEHYEQLLSLYAQKEGLSGSQIDVSPEVLKEKKFTGAEVQDLCQKASILEIPLSEVLSERWVVPLSERSPQLVEYYERERSKYVPAHEGAREREEEKPVRARRW